MGERGLDHVNVAVNDLEAARRTYHGTLGFGRPVRGDLAGGLQNINFYFGDATFLEILTARDPDKAPWVSRFLERGPGGLKVVLSVRAAEDAVKMLRQRGVQVGEPVPGAIHNEGSEAASSTWYKVLFPDGTIPGDCMFLIARPQEPRRRFLAQLRRPDIRERHFSHPNTAQGVQAVWLAVTQLDRAAQRLERVGLTLGAAVDLSRFGAQGLLVHAGRGSLLLLSPRDGQPAEALRQHLSRRGEGIFGISIRVADLDTARRLIEGKAGRGLVPSAGPLGRRLIVPPELTHGVWLELVQSPDPS